MLHVHLRRGRAEHVLQHGHDVLEVLAVVAEGAVDLAGGEEAGDDGLCAGVLLDGDVDGVLVVQAGGLVGISSVGSCMLGGCGPLRRAKRPSEPPLSR